jgi:hypothetical protein
MITSKWGLGIGVVVLTNSNDGLLVVYDVTQRALAVRLIGNIFDDARARAANTEFQRMYIRAMFGYM